MSGVLRPTLEEEFGCTQVDLAAIVFCFQVAYALGYISFGRVVDRVGARLGYAIAILIWTISHMAHGLASTVTQSAKARSGLGKHGRASGRERGCQDVEMPVVSASLKKKTDKQCITHNRLCSHQ